MAAGASDWFFVTHLGVPADFTNAHRTQGRGIGRLLLAEALRRMRALGYRHSVISTDEANNRAQLFYGNFGYRAVVWTHSYTRADLAAAQPPVLRAIPWLQPDGVGPKL